LVEDVRVSQKIAQMALKRARHTVDVAASGEEAVEKFKKHYKSLKLILMDIMLPKMSGVEATKEIREFERATCPSKRTTILGLTGNVSEGDLKKYKEADMDGCIAKGELLANAVKDALEKLAAKPSEFVVLTEVGSSGPGPGGSHVTIT
jgi:CheY-like chemotaxis protein